MAASLVPTPKPPEPCPGMLADAPSEVPKATATSGAGSVHMVDRGRSSLPAMSRRRSFTYLTLAPAARFAESAYLNFCGQALGSAKMAQPPSAADSTHANANDTTRMSPPTQRHAYTRHSPSQDR